MASSAQSKHTGGGETARLWSSRGEQGCAGGNRGGGSERGAATGVDSVVSDTAGV